MRKACWLAALAVALSPLAAVAQEYAIKIKRPGLGDKTRSQVTDNFQMEFKILDKDGNVVMEAQETKKHKFVFREVGLERAAAGEDLVRVKRHYEHAERHVKENRETLPYQGKTVLIEKKDDRFQFKIEDGETLEGKDAEELNEEFNKGDFRKLTTEHFLPRKAVKLNETWKYDVAPLAKAFTSDGKIEIDSAKSTGSGRLVKAYTKNGRQFGIIELTMEFPVTHLIDNDKKTPTKQGKFSIKLQADTCIDGTLDELRLLGTVSGDVRADVTVDGMDLNVAITLRATVEEQRALLK
ncbi:MAG: hypothetical protein L0Z62_11720 [Gemmataceae bacterium]|nr:hypothetical protein [Gemmataceae bacterium]